MRWLFPPALLVVVSALLALVAGVLVFWTRGIDTRSEPRPVPSGDVEIAWLYSATSSANWERFVTAARESITQLQPAHPDLAATIDDDAFPRQTTAVPEIGISLGAGRGRLLFRWYKLTSTHKTQDWIKALAEREPPPLAIIGGSTSDQAIDLARQLRDLNQANPQRPSPLLILTTATADNASDVADPTGVISDKAMDETGDTPLNRIYPGRTFRFCFTNQQMAAAVIDFIWSQDELRPDRDPVYTVTWLDDPYSRDLVGGFYRALFNRAAAASAEELGWQAGALAHGNFPLHLGHWQRNQFRWGAVSRPQLVDSSIGPFFRPNRFEAPVAEDMIDELAGNPDQLRPLLVLSAQTAPCRRFLHALERTARPQARRFVVATGDAVAFNTIYRDRNIAWPIQELPFTLVLFCHRNPTDSRVGFDLTGGPASRTGTEDLLLNMDIVNTLVQAIIPGDAVTLNPDSLAKRLFQARINDGAVTFEEHGVRLFDADGNRRAGSGEHVVWLQPVIEAERVKPQSLISVWSPHREKKAGMRWLQAGPPLSVHYERDVVEGGTAHAGP